MIICISGLAGSGKTTVAEAIIRELESRNYKVIHLTSDMIGFNLYHDHDKSLDYSSEQLSTIYSSLFFTIENIIRSNRETIIITDGMHRKTSMRIYLSMIADVLDIEFTLIKTATSKENSIQRLNKRFKNGGHGGWVDPKDYENPEFEDVFIINNDKNIENLKQQINNFLAKSQLNEYYFANNIATVPSLQP